MLSKKAKYGLQASFFLARNFNKGSFLIAEIAEGENIPKKFLEVILLELKKRGILHSKMGKGGGYALAKAPDKIFVGQIIRTLEGPLALVPCVSKTAYRKCDECIDEKTCAIRKMFKHVRDATSEIFDNTTLSEAMKAKFSIK